MGVDPTVSQHEIGSATQSTLFKKRHSQLSNWWHAPTSSLSLVDKIRVCLLLADTVCYLFYSPTSPGQLLQYTAHAQLLHCSWDCQAQICPHISYRNLKVWAAMPQKPIQWPCIRNPPSGHASETHLMTHSMIKCFSMAIFCKVLAFWAMPQ